MGNPAVSMSPKAVPLYLLCGALFFAPSDSALGEEVDFSCMSLKVWDKSHVSDRFSEHDVVLLNECQGPVYWSLCLERVEPWTGKVVETHNPVGYVEAGDKARVNLQLKRGTGHPSFRNRYQEIYVGTGFAIGSHARAACQAARCETQKRALREQVRGNTIEWEKAERALAAQIAEECPTSAWDNSTSEECVARVSAEHQVTLKAYPARERELRDALAAIDPDNCSAWGGGLVRD